MTSRAFAAWCFAFFIAALLSSNQSVSGQSTRPEEVTFPCGKLALHGFLYRPQGNGPFPVILYNHGSEQNPGSKPALGRFFASKG
jgi:hypothetical protein